MKQAVFATIANDIKKDVLEKKYATGGLLPSENTLCAKYDVTRTTVRRALALLLQENLITSIPGKGYVINSPNRNRFSMQFDELSCMRAKGVKSKLISVNIIEPDFDLMLKLRLMTKKKIVNIKRLFADNAGAVGFDEKFIIYYTGIPIVEKEIHYMTFPNIFANKTSVRELSEEIVLKAGHADAYVASLLGVGAKEPVALVEQTMIDSDGSILGWGRGVYRPEFFEINAISV